MFGAQVARISHPLCLRIQYSEMQKLILFTLVAATLASCATNTSTRSTQRKMTRPASSNSGNLDVLMRPVLADVSISEKREVFVYTTTSEDMSTALYLGGDKKRGNDNIFVSSREIMKKEAENRAQFAFLEEFKCDFLIDPIYLFQLENSSEDNTVKIKVQVSAYTAKYKSFTQPDSLPKSVIQANALADRELPMVTNTNSYIDRTFRAWAFTVGADGVLPFGDWAENTPYGYGGSAMLSYSLGKKMDVIGQYGIVSFAIDKGVSDTFKESLLRPAQIGVKAYFAQRDKGPFAFAQYGSYLFTTTRYDAAENMTTTINDVFDGFTVGIGYQINRDVDISAKYTTLGTPVQNSNYVGLRIAYRLFGSK
jgi:hypothetical protein